jgi:hypothetical protein
VSGQDIKKTEVVSKVQHFVLEDWSMVRGEV